MSFHLTAEDIDIDNNHVLVGRLRATDGSLRDTSIDLNAFLGNNDGHFEWEGQNFSETAQDVRFAIEGGGQVPVLRADLQTADGNSRAADVNLSERIENIDGHFTFR